MKTLNKVLKKIQKADDKVTQNRVKQFNKLIERLEEYKEFLSTRNTEEENIEILNSIINHISHYFNSPHTFVSIEDSEEDYKRLIEVLEEQNEALTYNQTIEALKNSIINYAFRVLEESTPTLELLYYHDQ